MSFVCPSCGEPLDLQASKVLERANRLKEDIAVAYYDGDDDAAGESHNELVAAEMWLAAIRKAGTS